MPRRASPEIAILAAQVFTGLVLGMIFVLLAVGRLLIFGLRALGEDLALVQHGDPVGDLHYDFDLVLDEGHGHARHRPGAAPATSPPRA